MAIRSLDRMNTVTRLLVGAVVILVLVAYFAPDKIKSWKKLFAGKRAADKSASMPLQGNV